MTVEETALTEEVLSELIRFSESWEAENSCWGYRRNEREDIEGRSLKVIDKNAKICKVRDFRRETHFDKEVIERQDAKE